jgi:hypothetical protein
VAEVFTTPPANASTITAPTDSYADGKVTYDGGKSWTGKQAPTYKGDRSRDS